MKQVVLDSSVLIKWFVQESESEKAASLLEAIRDEQLELVIPDVAVAELANALRFAKDIPQEECTNIIKAFLRLEPATIPLTEVIHQAIPMAYTHNLAIYDALFVAIAEKFDLELVTADYKHHLRSISDHIIWLSTLTEDYL